MAEPADRPAPLSGPLRLFAGHIAEAPLSLGARARVVWTTAGKACDPVVVLPAAGDGFDHAYRATTRELGPGVPPHVVRDVLVALIAAAGRKGGRNG